MKRQVKTSLKNFLGRAKVRKILWVSLIPLAFVIIRFNNIFDFEWYKSQFVGDSRWIKSTSRALIHYLLHGRRHGLTPSPFFVPEYIDRVRWKISVFDPLARYLVDRKKWPLVTSPVFSPKKNERFSRVSKPPLVSFLQQLDAATVIPADTSPHQLTWAELKPLMYQANQIYQQQAKLSAKTLPVLKFDLALERKTIDNYARYDLGGKTDLPLVSIIMPVWNRQDLVLEAIKSVQAQSLTNWELLITDDGSTDNTVDAIIKLQQADKRIKLFQPGHGGVCRARNNSLEHASGRWVAFLDSDNTWTPDYLQTMLAKLTDEGQMTAYSAIKMINKDSVRYRSTAPDLELLKIGNYIDLNALVVDRNILKSVGNFDEKLKRMVDYDLICRISQQTDFIYVPIIGVIYTDHEDVERITTTESTSWDGVVKSNNWINWKDSLKGRIDSLTSIIVPIRGDIQSAKRLLGSLDAEIDGRDDIEIIIADSSSTSAVNMTLSIIAASLSVPARHVRIPASHDNTLGANYGFSYSCGKTVVFVNQQVSVEPGWLSSLLESVKLTDGLVGSVQLKPSRLIHSAGEIFPTNHKLPIHFLENHPLSDIKSLDNNYRVPALLGGVVALSADLFAQMTGFYPLYNTVLHTHDLSLRAAEAGYPSYVAKSSQIINFNQSTVINEQLKKAFIARWQDKLLAADGRELWQKAGFEVLSYNQSTPKLKALKARRRWAIKISSPPDERRYAWGDTYYAEALAAALERLGQTVAIDYHGYHNRPTSYLDDVNLDLRGLDNYVPQKGKLNIMWVISHPEKVTPEMVRSFNKVYAAGSKWAEFMSQKSGRMVEFLPQSTDPAVFHPTKANPEFAGKILFVGNSRNVMRPIVRDSIIAGLDIAIYGSGWEGLVEPKYIKGHFIPNHQLTEAYSSAKVVLNDHWDDMRQWSFLSNRLFDATSAGARVITDDIKGIDEVFNKGRVQTYTTPEELKKIVASLDDGTNSAGGQAAHRDIKAQHSFDARAEELVRFIESV